MPETFSVQVCYDEPCHWTPPRRAGLPNRRPTAQTNNQNQNQNQNLPDTVDVPDDLPPLPPISQEDLELEKPLPQAHGDRPLPRINKRQLDHVDPQDRRRPQQHDLPQQHDTTRQQPHPQGQGTNPGPPVQEWPTPEELVEPAEVLHSNAANEVDPEVERLALERQQTTRKKKKNPKPLDMDAHMDTRYILRPEAIESVFYMWRITGDPEWREKGWKMWESIEKATWTELAYSAIEDVNDIETPRKADSMERYPSSRCFNWL